MWGEVSNLSTLPSMHFPYVYPNRITKLRQIFQTRPLSYPPSCCLNKYHGIDTPVHPAKLPPVIACSSCYDSRKHTILIEVFKCWFFTRRRFHKRQIPELLITNRGNVDTNSLNAFFSFSAVTTPARYLGLMVAGYCRPFR